MEAVFFNGTIYTMDPARPVVEAVATGGGRIVASGASDELLRGLCPGVVRIDLGGRTVIPGLTDAHAHFLGYAEASAWLDLAAASSLDEVLRRVSDAVSRSKGGTWIRGRGWDQNDWQDARYPEKAALDSVAPDNPVILVRVCGHAAYVNSAALRAAGVTRDTADPAAGRILRGADGEPTGILIDDAKDIVSSRIPPPTREEMKKLVVSAAERCLAAGLVGVHEMGISSADDTLYRELYAEGSLPFRITAFLSESDPALGRYLEAGPVRGAFGDRYSIVGVKFYADGSLGARSAALIEDYSDDPGNRGILMKDAGDLAAGIRRCHEAGFQAAVHAIGDAAVRGTLDAYEAVLAGGPARDARHRIEHAQVVSPEDIPRFARLGVIPSMQFTHCTSDMSWAEARLSALRLGGAYAWRSLIQAGCRIPGGSDFPVESIDPFLGIYAAATRRDLAGKPEGGWRSEECLTVEEAVRAFSADAAYAARAERVAGVLAPGALADFIVLSDDIFSIEPEAIPRIRVLATVLGGRIVHGSRAF